MDEGSCNPQEVRSFQAIKAFNSNIINLTRKRKLELEQVDWRSLKRKCWEHGRIMSEKVTSENKSQGIGSDDLTRSEVNDKRDEGIGTEESVLQYESAEGGNSFADGISSAISLQGEASFQPKYRKCGDTPSTSIANPECFVSDEKKYYSDDLRVSRQGGDKGKSIVRMGEGSSRCIDDESQICETLEEHLLEFGCRLGYTCSEYGIDGSNQCEDKEIEELFGLGQENFILSSGQWNTNEETETIPRKPTIDQEFEEYFSSLMM